MIIKNKDAQQRLDGIMGHRTKRIQRRGVEKEVKLFIFRRLVVDMQLRLNKTKCYIALHLCYI